MNLNFTDNQVNTIFIALEELYDNLEYNELDNDELENQRNEISSIIGKILNEAKK